jgi:hypothetical protein
VSLPYVKPINLIRIDIRALTLFSVILLLLSCVQKERPLVYNQALVKRFVINLKGLTPERSDALMDSLLTASSQDSVVFRKTAAYLEKPFTDPNSTYRNENLSIKLYRSILGSPHYKPEEKIRPEYKLKLAMQNRVGDKANDFSFILPTGEKKMLSSITASRTLLFFYNPECPACKVFKTSLESSPIIHEQVQAGSLSIVAIYTDNDLDLWRNSLPETSKTWIVGHDENEFLHKNGVYDLTAIPTAYLLDNNKVVILKDVTDIFLVERLLM